MIIWILMVLDLAVLATVSFAHFGIAFSEVVLFYSAGYLLLKFLLFREIMSGIDAVFGVYILIVAFFHVSTFFYYFLLGWFLYKLMSTVMGEI